MLFVLDYRSYPFRSLEEMLLNGTPFGTHFSQQYIITKGFLKLISLITSILFWKEQPLKQSSVSLNRGKLRAAVTLLQEQFDRL